MLAEFVFGTSCSLDGSLTDSEFIDLVYDNVLERTPDDGGRRFWLDRMADGLARGAVMTAFSESPEYVGKTNAEIVVRSIYEGLLQREPDPSGFAFWVSEYRSGRSLTGMIRGFLESDEYANRFWVVDPAPVEPNAEESGTWSVTTVPKVNRP